MSDVPYIKRFIFGFIDYMCDFHRLRDPVSDGYGEAGHIKIPETYIEAVKKMTGITITSEHFRDGIVSRVNTLHKNGTWEETFHSIITGFGIKFFMGIQQLDDVLNALRRVNTKRIYHSDLSRYYQFMMHIADNKSYARPVVVVLPLNLFRINGEATIGFRQILKKYSDAWLQKIKNSGWRVIYPWHADNIRSFSDITIVTQRLGE